MSMLAERRTQKIYTLVPRGKALYEDKNNFGLRMLEKMGWTEGKGLGAKENGNKEFLRLKYKNDSVGFGYEDRNDQWKQCEDNYHEILEILNNSLKSNNSDVPEKTTTNDISNNKMKSEIVEESLEMKSKKSRARVHYMKFTKGKDCIRYNDKDLANIFGKKTLNDIEKDVKKVDKSGKEVNNLDYSMEYGVLTKTATTSSNDYFAEMKRKKILNSENKLVNDTISEEEAKDSSSISSTKRKSKNQSLQISSNDHTHISKEMNCEIMNNQIKEKELTGNKGKKCKRKKEFSEAVNSNEESCSQSQLSVENNEYKSSKKRKEGNKELEMSCNHQEMSVDSNAIDSNYKSKTKNNENTTYKDSSENSVNSYSTGNENGDFYQTNTCVLEKFRNVAFNMFKESNIKDIFGYSYNEEFEIKLPKNKMSITYKVADMWSKSENKQKQVSNKKNSKKLKKRQKAF